MIEQAFRSVRSWAGVHRLQCPTPYCTEQLPAQGIGANVSELYTPYIGTLINRVAFGEPCGVLNQTEGRTSIPQKMGSRRRSLQLPCGRTKQGLESSTKLAGIVSSPSHKLQGDHA